MQQHATRDTSIPNIDIDIDIECAASQPAMKCGPASLRSHQSSAKRPACSSVSQPLAISERNRQVLMEGAVAPSISQKEQPQRQQVAAARAADNSKSVPSSLLALPSSLLPLPSSLFPPPYHTAHHHLPDPPLPLSLPLRSDQGTAWSKQCDGQLSSQSGSKEQQAPSPPPPLHSTPLSFPMPLLPPPPHLLPLTSFPHTPLLLLSLTLTQARSAHSRTGPRTGKTGVHTLTLTLGGTTCQTHHSPGGATKRSSQEEQPGAAARSSSSPQDHAPNSQKAQLGGRSSSQQEGSKESAMAHGDNSEWPAPCTSVAPIAQPYREHAPCCLQV
ncbi:hypothetical protein QJQ45_017625 [Haematococcus lacustris]|nr:hypothetical protein QJQ45_017625 [Haematococcus lacustris]